MNSWTKNQPYTEQESKLYQTTQAAFDELGTSLAKYVKETGMNVYNNLIRQERLEFSKGAEQPTRLAKIILCAIADRIEMQFSCEAIKAETAKLKRICKNRYC